MRGNTKAISMALAGVLIKKELRKGTSGNNRGYYGVELNWEGEEEIEKRRKKTEFSS